MPIPSLILALPSLLFLLVLVTPSNVGEKRKERKERRLSLSHAIWSDVSFWWRWRSRITNLSASAALWCLLFLKLPAFPQIIRLLVPLLLSFYMTHHTESKIIFSYWPFKAPTHASTILFSHCVLIKPQLQSRIFHCSDTGRTRAIYTGSKAFLL